MKENEKSYKTCTDRHPPECYQSCPVYLAKQERRDAIKKARNKEALPGAFLATSYRKTVRSTQKRK